MMMKMKSAVALVVLALVLAGCIGAARNAAGQCTGSCPFGTTPSADGCACVPDSWAGDWYSVSIIAVLTLVFAMALLYMAAEGFDLQHLKLSLREEFVQSIITVIIIAGLAAFIWSADNFILPQLAATAHITTADLSPANMDLPSHDIPVCAQVWPGGSFKPFAFAQCYTETVKSTLSSFTATIESLAISIGKASSVTTYCQLLGSTLGFAITSLRYVGSTQGTLGLAMTALTTAQITMHAQALLLSLSQQFLVFLLPLGALLRCIKPTRQAGGALIAIAVGFYFIYPLMILVDYTMVADKAFKELAPDGSRNYFAKPDFPPEIKCDEMGACRGDAEYLDKLVGSTSHADAKAHFIEPMAFWTIIVSILLPVMNLLITLTFIRWFSSAMGSEIEVSQLARVT